MKNPNSAFTVKTMHQLTGWMYLFITRGSVKVRTKSEREISCTNGKGKGVVLIWKPRAPFDSSW